MSLLADCKLAVEADRGKGLIGEVSGDESAFTTWYGTISWLWKLKSGLGSSGYKAHNTVGQCQGGR